MEKSKRGCARKMVDQKGWFKKGVAQVNGTGIS